MRRVFGTLSTKPPTHHNGNSTKDTKNIHAWIGLAPSPFHGCHFGYSSSPGEGSDSDHGVECTRGGLCGSRMWKCRLCDAMDTDGALGATSADMGMEDPEIMLLREMRDGARCTLGTCRRMDDAAREGGRVAREGGRRPASCGGSKMAAKGMVPPGPVLRRLVRLAVESCRPWEECWRWTCARGEGEGEDWCWCWRCPGLRSARGRKRASGDDALESRARLRV